MRSTATFVRGAGAAILPPDLGMEPSPRPLRRSPDPRPPPASMPSPRSSMESVDVVAAHSAQTAGRPRRRRPVRTLRRSVNTTLADCGDLVPYSHRPDRTMARPSPSSCGREHDGGDARDRFARRQGCRKGRGCPERTTATHLGHQVPRVVLGEAWRAGAIGRRLPIEMELFYREDGTPIRQAMDSGEDRTR